MNGVEKIESILELSEISASFFVVEIKEDKSRKRIVFRSAKTAKDHITHHEVIGGKAPKKVEGHYKSHAKSPVIADDLFGNEHAQEGGQNCQNVRKSEIKVNFFSLIYYCLEGPE